MNLTFVKKVTFRYLFGREWERFTAVVGLIAILGIAIGVASLNIVMAIMTGFQNDFREKILGNESHILIESPSGTIEDWEKIVSTLDNEDAIESITPQIVRQVLIRSTSRNTTATLVGIEEDSAVANVVRQRIPSPIEEKEYLFAPQAIYSELNDNSISLPAVVLGMDVARYLSIGPGEIVSVFSIDSNSTRTITPRMKRFVVSSIVAGKNASHRIDRTVFSSLEVARELSNATSGISSLELRVKDVDSAPELRRKIQQLLYVHNPTAKLELSDWTSRNRPLLDAMTLLRRVYFTVLLLITIMAASSIVTTLILLVIKKRDDIAILKTIGASTFSIAGIFQLLGLCLGGLGVIAGSALGFVACLLLRQYGFPIDERIFEVSELPVAIEPIIFVVIGLSALAVSFLATIYPAVRAARSEPVGVLRMDG